MSNQPTRGERPRDFELSLGERRDREQARWRRSLLVSLGVHVLVGLFFLGTRPVIPPSPFSAAGPQNNDDEAAAGGMQVVTIRVPPQEEIIRPPPPIETPSLEFRPVEVADVPQVEVELAQLAGELPDPDTGPGTTNGEGQGDGGTTEEGRFTLVPPSPRGMIIPPTNRDLRGREVEVWVFVDVRGRVVADSTRLNPPTGNGDFNRRLIREAAEWIFNPARRGEEAVASWFPYKISMDR